MQSRNLRGWGEPKSLFYFFFFFFFFIKKKRKRIREGLLVILFFLMDTRTVYIATPLFLSRSLVSGFPLRVSPGCALSLNIHTHTLCLCVCACLNEYIWIRVLKIDFLQSHHRLFYFYSYFLPAFFCRIIIDHATPVGRRSAFATHVLLLERGAVLHNKHNHILLLFVVVDVAQFKFHDW